jgi:hypothetical protein
MDQTNLNLFGETPFSMKRALEKSNQQTEESKQPEQKKSRSESFIKIRESLILLGKKVEESKTTLQNLVSNKSSTSNQLFNAISKDPNTKPIPLENALNLQDTNNTNNPPYNSNNSNIGFNNITTSQFDPNKTNPDDIENIRNINQNIDITPPKNPSINRIKQYLSANNIKEFDAMLYDDKSTLHSYTFNVSELLNILLNKIESNGLRDEYAETMNNLRQQLTKNKVIAEWLEFKSKDPNEDNIKRVVFKSFHNKMIEIIRSQPISTQPNKPIPTQFPQPTFINPNQEYNFRREEQQQQAPQYSIFIPTSGDTNQYKNRIIDTVNSVSNMNFSQFTTSNIFPQSILEKLSTEEKKPPPQALGLSNFIKTDNIPDVTNTVMAEYFSRGFDTQNYSSTIKNVLQFKIIDNINNVLTSNESNYESSLNEFINSNLQGLLKKNLQNIKDQRNSSKSENLKKAFNTSRELLKNVYNNQQYRHQFQNYLISESNKILLLLNDLIEKVSNTSLKYPDKIPQEIPNEQSSKFVYVFYNKENSVNERIAKDVVHYNNILFVHSHSILSIRSDTLDFSQFKKSSINVSFHDLIRNPADDPTGAILYKQQTFTDLLFPVSSTDNPALIFFNNEERTIIEKDFKSFVGLFNQNWFNTEAARKYFNHEQLNKLAYRLVPIIQVIPHSIVLEYIHARLSPSKTLSNLYNKYTENAYLFTPPNQTPEQQQQQHLVSPLLSSFGPLRDTIEKLPINFKQNLFKILFIQKYIFFFLFIRHSLVKQPKEIKKQVKTEPDCSELLNDLFSSKQQIITSEMTDYSIGNDIGPQKLSSFEFSYGQYLGNSSFEIIYPKGYNVIKDPETTFKFNEFFLTPSDLSNKKSIDLTLTLFVSKIATNKFNLAYSSPAKKLLEYSNEWYYRYTKEMIQLPKTGVTTHLYPSVYSITPTVSTRKNTSIPQPKKGQVINLYDIAAKVIAKTGQELTDKKDITNELRYLLLKYKLIDNKTYNTFDPPHFVRGDYFFALISIISFQYFVIRETSLKSIAYKTQSSNIVKRDCYIIDFMDFTDSQQKTPGVFVVALFVEDITGVLLENAKINRTDVIDITDTTITNIITNENNPHHNSLMNNNVRSLASVQGFDKIGLHKQQLYTWIIINIKNVKEKINILSSLLTDTEFYYCFDESIEKSLNNLGLSETFQKSKPFFVINKAKFKTAKEKQEIKSISSLIKKYNIDTAYGLTNTSYDEIKNYHKKAYLAYLAFTEALKISK